MKMRQDSSIEDWRRRAQHGSRDIVVAVALTVLAIALLGFAWLGGSRAPGGMLGPSAKMEAGGQ